MKFGGKWMDLESIVLREVTQTQKAKRKHWLCTIFIAKLTMYLKYTWIFQSKYKCGLTITSYDETIKKEMLGDSKEGQNTDKVSHELWKANSYFF